MKWKPAEPLPPQRLATGRMLLALGIALRIVVFWFLDPLNNDAGHLDVIKYIVEHRALPAATASFESYQPPLYYLLAAPFYAASGNVKWVQVLSLAFSILTLAGVLPFILRRQTSGRSAAHAAMRS